MKETWKDVAAGLATVGALACPVIAVRWLWEHGWKWPAWVATAGVAVLMLGTIGSKVRDAAK